QNRQLLLVGDGQGLVRNRFWQAEHVQQLIAVRGDQRRCCCLLLSARFWGAALSNGLLGGGLTGTVARIFCGGFAEGNLTSCFGSGGLLQYVGHAIDWVNLQAKFAGLGVGIVVVIDALDKIMRAEFSSELEEDRPVLLIDSPAADARV